MINKIKKLFKKQKDGSLTIETIVVTPIMLLLVVLTMVFIFYPAVEASTLYQSTVDANFYDYCIYAAYSLLQ